MSRMKDPFANEADHDEGRGVDPMSFVAKPALRPQVDVVEEITRAATADGFKTNSPKRRRAKAARLPFSMRLTEDLRDRFVALGDRLDLPHDEVLAQLLDNFGE